MFFGEVCTSQSASKNLVIGLLRGFLYFVLLSFGLQAHVAQLNYR